MITVLRDTLPPVFYQALNWFGGMCAAAFTIVGGLVLYDLLFDDGGWGYSAWTLLLAVGGALLGLAARSLAITALRFNRRT
jgi:hypothetical protein